VTGLRIAKFTLLIALAGIVKAQPAIVQIDSFYSSSVQLKLKYIAVLPANYKSETKHYPVVYLLHGHTGNFTSWMSYAKLPVSLATQYNCIIILPDAGNSWYVNWTGQTDGKPHQWEDMLVKDLIPDVDKKYRTIKEKSGRVIGGLSMGGYGALAVGLKNANMFGFVFSSAGAIDFCKYIKEEFSKDTLDWNSPVLWSEDKKTVDIPQFSNWKERTPPGIVFKQPSDADLYDPYLLLEKADTASLPFIHIDCGNKDYHLKAALNFTEKLKKKTNRYSLLIMPGNHEVPYWEQAIRHTFLLLSNQFFVK
jgi:putative tributyrin esterase